MVGTASDRADESDALASERSSAARRCELVRLQRHQRARHPRGSAGTAGGASGVRQPCVIVLSARSEPALQALARRHATYLADGPETSLRNFATMLATGRTHYERRLAFVADSISHAIATLRRAGDGEWPDGVVGRRRSDRRATEDRVPVHRRARGVCPCGSGSLRQRAGISRRH